jgi:hypothetical protein
MKNVIKREDILAIINMKNVSAENGNFLLDKINTDKATGDPGFDTMVVEGDLCHMVEPSSKYLMKKLNKTLYLNIGGKK